MRRIASILLLVLCLAAGSVFAQTDINNFHQKTTTPPDARFEIVRSEPAARWTFRLDRYTGNVYQLVKTKDDGIAWEQMPVEGLPEIPNAGTPRFVLFTSGRAAQHTFLMDSKTGKTWFLKAVDVSVGEGQATTIHVWTPLEESSDREDR